MQSQLEEGTKKVLDLVQTLVEIGDSCYLTDDDKLVFENGNDILYHQDMSMHIGIPPDVPFNVELFTKDEIKITANGYGKPPPGYGNGAIYTWLKYLPEHIREELKQKET